MTQVWPRTEITYSVRGSLPGVGRLTVADAGEPAAMWSDSPVELRPADRKADISIECLPLPLRVLGQAGFPCEDGRPVRCVLNSERFWCRTTDDPGVLLPAILVHELGHALGLPHAEGDTVMWPAWSRAVRRSPSSADLAVLGYLYGPPCKNDHTTGRSG